MLELRVASAIRSSLAAVTQKAGPERRCGMTGPLDSYCSPKLDVRAAPAKGGFGIFAGEAVAAGELLIVWGGRIVTQAELDRMQDESRRHSIQVEEGIFCVPLQAAEPADYVNHSCMPNAGLSGQIALTALREIAAGEEICYDYATSDSCPYDEFECACGSPVCRGWVTGNDWKKPELWERYAGYFSPYLQRRIDRLKLELSEGAGDMLVDLTERESVERGQP
jgi:hypothetical protein